MNYRVRLWCRDCTGQDDKGCFDGGTQILDGVFATVEEATAEGQAVTRDCGPWEFDVIDEDDNEVEETGERS